MTNTDKVALGVLIFTAATSLLTGLQVRQVTKQSKELAASLEAGVIMKLIIDYLQKPEEIEARKRIYELHRTKVPYEIWHADKDDREKADRVIRSYEVIGIMTRRCLLNRAVVIAMWGRRAMMIDETLNPYREDICDTMKDPDSYENLRWLANCAREHYKKEAEAENKQHQQVRARKWESGNPPEL